MSMAAQTVSFGHHAVAANTALRAPLTTVRPDDWHPSADPELPFLLVPLEEVRVKCGAMQGETMQDAHDLVEGDAWSLQAITSMIPADTSLEEGGLRVEMSAHVEVGRRSFAAEAAMDLWLMSDCGATLRCKHVRDRSSGQNGRSLLLLPAGADLSKSYELISKAA